MNRHVKEKEYAITKKRSKKNKSSLVNKTWIACDQNQKFKYKDQEHRLHIFSRVTECSFECIAKLKNDEKNVSVNENQKIWSLMIKHDAHNYSSSLSAAHSAQRKLTMTTDVLREIAKKQRKDSSTKQIMIDLRMNANEENSFFKTRDIYNAIAHLRKEELDSLTSTQTLMRDLSDNDKWFMKIEKNDLQRLQYLFFTSNFMQKLLIENLEVLIMNCIYKTNRYKMPLLIIIDVTNLNIFFYVDFCFMKDERFNDYVWALKTTKELYELLQLQSSIVILSNDDKTLAFVIIEIYDVDQMQHELCVWHIEKNVLEHVKKGKYFDINEKFEIFMNRFKDIIYVSIVAILEERYNNLYRDVDVDIVIYIEETHWDHRKKWAKYYIDKFLHFDNITISRDEKEHHVLKNRLQYSIDELLCQLHR